MQHLIKPFQAGFDKFVQSNLLRHNGSPQVLHLSLELRHVLRGRAARLLCAALGIRQLLRHLLLLGQLFPQLG